MAFSARSRSTSASTVVTRDRRSPIASLSISSGSGSDMDRVNHTPYHVQRTFCAACPGICPGLMLLEPARRRRRLVGLGAAVTLGFIVLRATNVYLDPAPWTPHDSIGATVLSFVNTEKYPPSTLYLAMTLGPALLALAAFDSARGKLASFFVLFGRVPLFYYIAHLLLLHALAVVFAAVSHGEVAWMFGGSPDRRPSRRATGWTCLACT